MNETLDLMRRHVSVREFTDEQIPEATLRELLEAGRAAATWRSLQSYSVVVVDDERRRAIFELLDQQFIADCSHFLVFVGDLHRASMGLAKHGHRLDPAGAEPLLITAVDASLVAQNVLLGAQSLGYGGVFCGYVRWFAEEIAEILDLPEHTYPLVGLALGRPASTNPVRPRLPHDAVVFEGGYGEVSPDVIDDYDATIAAYPADPRPGAWSDRFVDQFGPGAQTSSTDHLRRQGFL